MPTFDKLKDVTVKSAKPKEKPYKLADGKGLYLLVTTKGGKLWKVKYRFTNIEKKLSLGSYPEISLSKGQRIA